MPLFCFAIPHQGPRIVSVSCDLGVKLFWNLFSVLRLQKQKTMWDEKGQGD